MSKKKLSKLLALYLPYVVIGLVATNLGEAWRLAVGKELGDKIVSLMDTLPAAFSNPLPSLHLFDLFIGLCCGAGMRLAVYLKGKNAKKYRHGMEYGSARWGTPKDIEPFMAPKFADNIILTKTERLMMSNRPPDPKNARNKNVLVVGGSGSGKTRFWLKPNLLQCHSSYVVTDPKGSIVVECGNALLQKGYKLKIFNTINFSKSMRYNPMAYIHSEKDILKLVTALMTNTKGEGQGGDPFWDKAERLLLVSLIAYLHYEAPVEEQNFATLLEMLNTMQVSEDDETYQNPVDLLFEDLGKKKPKSFAVRQYKLYKLAAGVVCSKRLLNQAVGKSLRTHNLKPKKGAQVMRKNEKITALYERLSRDDFGKDDDQQRESNSISNQKAMLEEFAARQGKLKETFKKQYKLTTWVEVQIRYKTVWVISPAGIPVPTQVPYEYRIFHTKLVNKGLEVVIREELDNDQWKRYEIFQDTLGGRPYLFNGGLPPGGSDGSGTPGIDYQVPAEALTDSEFAAIYKEAQKYVGTPYVWGGSTPETGFDCSGYVCWVYNQNGYNVGRTTANGLWNKSQHISEAEAKPGDLVFFEGTYDTPGKSHVGIYLGNGKMVSAGDPIKYADIHSSYWQKYLSGFGRLSK